MTEWLRDGIGLCSYAALCVGAYLMYPPAGWIVAGLLGLLYAVFATSTGGGMRR